MSNSNIKEVSLFDLYGEKIYIKDKTSRANVGTITIKKENDTSYASSYKLYINDVSVGDTINIPKDMVVQSGSLKECTTENQPISGLLIGDKYIDLLIANSDNQHIYISLKDIVDLSDYYNKNEVDKLVSFSGKETDYGTISVENNEISISSAVGKRVVTDSDGTTNKGEIFNDYISNIASGNYSHAHGFNNSAEGMASDSTGLSNISSGKGSHTNGVVCEAIGDYSSCIGYGLVTKGNSQTAVGKLNEYDEENKYAFIVGVGSNESSTIEDLSSAVRKNGFAVDWNGNIEFLGDAFYHENGNKVSLKELLMNNGKLFSNTIPEDSILVNNTKYQIGHISSDINCKLPSTGSEIELTFGTLDPPYNLYCENCLSFTTSRNTYYHIVFYYDKTLGAWYPKVY